MKKRTSKLLSLLLTLTMVLGMLPVMSITAFADYADGMDCLACGHYHWDENVCGMCGLCSKECSSSCWEEFHCQYGCGACYLEIDYWCPECGLCEDCMEGVDFHCKECRACLQSDDLCQDCGKCENCVGWLCMDCGQCDECTDNGEFHCEECGGCYETNGHEHGTHCADCCEICEQCGGCIILNETEFCFECGLCEACCEENRDASDCSCGEYCVESVEFEEHFCEFCGNCFDDVDQCELCYLCADCCADNSDCSDGLCVEDPDYEDHFCEDCGTCFCEADQCETCAGEGELRCVYCCESLASSYGCDCGDVCVNDPDFEEHLETVHSEDGVIGPHTAKPQNVWSMDETYHWHECTDASCPDKTGSVKDQAAHTASDWIIDTPATSTTSGSKHKECTDCHQVLVTETIPATGSSSGSVSGVTTYAITVEEADNGNVTADRKSAAKGTTVTLTIAPDKGYTLETLTVTDKNGDELKIKEKNGKYTFKMPASKVYVEATFMEDNSMLNFFVDVPADAYYYDAVLWAADKEITGGTDAVHFSPDATCTRAQAVTFLWRAVGSPLVNYDMNFSDVPADAYYTEAVRWAVSQGITKGTGETTFSPNATCTRGQIVTFLYRTVQAQGGGMQGAWMFQNPFTDVSLESYCGEAVMWAVANGVTEGTSETTFGPDARCTRGQIVTFLFRCLGK